MRCAQGPDSVRLFKVSEFLTPQQCTSYFSRLAAKVRRQTSDDAEIQAVVEEENFTMARETILSITLQHPITYDQYDICAMAKGGSLERLKLGMLQNICQQLELEVPPKPVRRKALYVDLLFNRLAVSGDNLRAYSRHKLLSDSHVPSTAAGGGGGSFHEVISVFILCKFS